MPMPSVTLWIAKPSDEERAEPGGTRREGRADGETFAEIVKPDAERDVERERQPRGHASPPPDRQAG